MAAIDDSDAGARIPVTTKSNATRSTKPMEGREEEGGEEETLGPRMAEAIQTAEAKAAARECIVLEIAKRQCRKTIVRGRKPKEAKWMYNDRQAEQRRNT